MYSGGNDDDDDANDEYQFGACLALKLKLSPSFFGPSQIRIHIRLGDGSKSRSFTAAEAAAQGY